MQFKTFLLILVFVLVHLGHNASSSIDQLKKRPKNTIKLRHSGELDGEGLSLFLPTKKKVSRSSTTKSALDNALENVLRLKLEKIRGIMTQPITVHNNKQIRLEPLKISNYLGTVQDTIKFKLKRAYLKGLSTFKVSKLSADIKKLHLTLILQFDNLFINGLYDLKGQAWVFPVTGKGNFHVTLGNTVVNAVVILNKTKSNDLNIHDIQLDMTIGSMKSQLDNLMEGKAMSQFAHEFINTRSQYIFDIVKPNTLQNIEKVLEGRLDDFMPPLNLKTLIKEAKALGAI